MGRNPLRRFSDRVESVVLVVACVLGLLVVPVVAALGTEVHRAAVAEAAAQRAASQEVTATTLEEAPMLPAEAHIVADSPAMALWQAPDGTSRRGIVSAPQGSPAGTAVTVWLDTGGALTTTPKTALQSRIAGIAAGVGALLGAELSLLTVVVLVRLGLNRLRLRGWAREWAVVSPRWTGRG